LFGALTCYNVERVVGGGENGASIPPWNSRAAQGRTMNTPLGRQLPGPIAALLAFGVLAAATLAAPAHAEQVPGCVWMDRAKPAAERAHELLDAMTTDQKLRMVHGVGTAQDLDADIDPLFLPDMAASGGRGAGWVPGIPQLCVPPLYLSDGGQGLSDGATGVTAFPSPIAQAATFDTGLIADYGSRLAGQLLAKGLNVFLGPDVNAGRDPGFSRNFEGIGGEDPYLQGELAAAMVRGVQSKPVIATVKHYLGYDASVPANSVIDPRTLNEMYVKPFMAPVRAGVGAVMCSYNSVNGVHSCQNPGTLGILEHSLGFGGFVMSDWGATHSTVDSADAGLDMEMAAGNFYGAPLARALADGRVPRSRLDNMVGRILTQMFARGLFDTPPAATVSGDAVGPGDAALARRMAEEATVLLRNNRHLLPLTGTHRSLAVVGLPAAQTGANQVYQAALSPDSKVTANVSAPLDAIVARAAAAGDTVAYSDGILPAAAAAVAKNADAAIVFVGNIEGELFFANPPTFALPAAQNQLIAQVAAANPNTIVVVDSGRPVAMPWLDSVAGVLEAWLPGEQDGNAIAGILFGDADPGGRLPQTFPVSSADEPAADGSQTYLEGLYTGYRWFDHTGKPILFPFGYGLSYTTFGYRNLSAPARIDGSHPVVVSLAVTNTGGRAGSDTPQIYLGWPAGAAVTEPARQLRGFAHVELNPGESRTIAITLDQESFSYWNTATQSWAVQPGCYPVYASHSERDTALVAHIAVAGGGCP
jgi:beta-glucosidase